MQPRPRPERPAAIFDYRELLAASWSKAKERHQSSAVQRAAQAGLAMYAERPVGFVRNCLGERSWSASRALLRAVWKHHLVAACGCRKSTKSHTSSQAGLAMTLPMPTRTIVTAPTYKQVRENIFARMRKLHAMAPMPLPGKMGVTSIRMDDPTWYAIGVSTNQPENMLGFHADVTLPAELEFDEEMIDEDSLLPPDARATDEDARLAERHPGEVIEQEIYVHKKASHKARLFFLIDEMSGMDGQILEMILGSLMGDNVYALAPFNPTFEPESDHPAARFLKKGSRFHRFHIAGREPPVELHPPDMFDECYHRVPPALMPDKWVAESIAEWGETSALTMAHVYGLPATSDRERQFIPFRILRDRLDVHMVDDKRVQSRHIGWDVAGSDGGDWNVAQLWVCGRLTEHERWRWADTAASTARVLELAHKWGLDGIPIPSRNIHVDATGGSLGKACVDFMRAQGHRVDGVDFGAEPQGDWTRLVGPDMYFVNRKAELLWVVRCALQKGLAGVPRAFSDFIRQAQWYTFKEKSRAQGTALQCAEDKIKIKELYGRSPDDLEAGMLAWSRANRGITIATASDMKTLGKLVH